MPRLYYEDGHFEEVENINGYLLPAPHIYVESRTTPLCPVPIMCLGNMPRDDGNLTLSSDEREEFIKKCPQAEKYIRQFLGAEEFLHNKKRYCLWLVDCPPDEIKNNKFIYERVKNVKIFREKSKREGTRKLAEVPHLFAEIRQPNENYILVPRHSSEKRKYIPIDYVSPEIICGDANLMIPNAELWHFGILTSKVHMAWTKAICGRLTSRLRYSAKIVYNNFVWMRMYHEDYEKLNIAAQKILDCRKKYPNASLADLYDEVTMPKDLRRAHREVDKIAMKIYHLDEDMSDEDIAVTLLMMYEEYKNFVAGKV